MIIGPNTAGPSPGGEKPRVNASGTPIKFIDHGLENQKENWHASIMTKLGGLVKRASIISHILVFQTITYKSPILSLRPGMI